MFDRTSCLLLLLCLSSVGVASFAEDKSTADVAALKAHWQSALDADVYRFNEKHLGVLYSLSQYGDQDGCDIAMVYSPKDPFGLKFNLLRDGKVLASVNGTVNSVFVGLRGVFYFADFSSDDCGCRVLALDAKTGVKVWQKELLAAGKIQHSGYENEVEICVIDGANPVLIINGREGAGEYVEVLEAANGTTLAHKKLH